MLFLPFSIEDTKFYSEPRVFEDPYHYRLGSNKFMLKYPDHVYL